MRRARELQKAAIRALGTIETDADAGVSALQVEITDLAPRTNSVDPVTALSAQVEAEIDGTRTALGIPFIQDLARTQFFLPGSITVIVGSAGASKSLFTNELNWRLWEFGTKSSKLDLESPAQFHLRRTLAQMAGDSRVTNAEYAVRFKDEIRSTIIQFHEQTSRLIAEKTMQVPPTTNLMKCADLLRHISQEADKGRDVIMIDPITMMDTEDRGHLAQVKFIQSARALVDRKQIRLLLVTHPKKTGGGVDTNVIHLDNLSGSTAFQWFVDSVFWLEAHALARKTFYCQLAPSETYTEDYNRTIHILKARLGGMTGKKIAYYLNPDTLRHVPRGILE